MRRGAFHYNTGPLMRLRMVLLCLVPGAAHVDLGRAKWGLLLFFLFAFLVNGALIAPILTAGGRGATLCWLGAAGVWIAAFYSAVRTAGKDAAAKKQP